MPGTMCADNGHLLAVAWWVIFYSLDLFQLLFLPYGTITKISNFQTERTVCHLMYTKYALQDRSHQIFNFYRFTTYLHFGIICSTFLEK